MMLRKEEPAGPVGIPTKDALQLFRKDCFLKELLLDPDRQRHCKGFEPLWSVGKVRLEQPFELEEWLIVENDAVKLFRADPGFFYTVPDRVLRKTRIVFDACEPLFLRGR